MTASCWPMRWQRSSAWSCLAGVQSSSRKATFEARVRVRPWPATSREQTISWFAASSGVLESAQRRRRAPAGCLRRGCAARAGKRSSTARWISRWRANTTRGSPEEQEVVDPGERGVELAAGGEQLQRVEPDESLGAERGGDLGVELAQVQRLAAKPGDEIAARRGGTRARCRARWGRCRGSSAAAEAGRRPSAGGRSSVRAGASAGAWWASGPRKRRPNWAPEPKSPRRPRMRSWEIELRRAVHHGRAGESEDEALGGDRRGEAVHGLRALGAQGSCSSGTRRARGREGRAPSAAPVGAQRRCRS